MAMTDKEKEMKKKAYNFMVDNDIDPSNPSPMDFILIAMETAEDEGALEKLQAIHHDASKLIESYQNASPIVKKLFGCVIMKEFLSDTLGTSASSESDEEEFVKHAFEDWDDEEGKSA